MSDGQVGDSLFSSLHSSYREQLSEQDFDRLSKFIYSVAGIKLPPVKRIMLQSRLQKRLRALDIPDFKTYTDYVTSAVGQQEELVQMWLVRIRRISSGSRFTLTIFARWCYRISCRRANSAC